jgi:predicted ATPase/DNA-binding CsgD family transcriptional regulator
MGAGRSAGGLRGELTEFVGRRAELARVREALAGARLVTLTGPGGIGKTRLALQVAAGAGRAFADGVWLAELAELRDPGLLVGEVARSLGLSDRSARYGVASLADYLQARRVLLVLDGCEHLADACAVLADALLRGCQGLRIITTSRHVLGVAGEVTIPVPPMTVPAIEGPNGPGELLRFEAVRLFADRAAAVLPGFAVDAGNGAAVAGVCRAVDGIPLAVELAAVRLRSLSPEQILSRLGSRFQLLSGGGPAGQPHHRTLQAALEWSYELLADGEQAMWRRMSVFAGSFDLDAAEAVCAVGRVATGEIADLVDALVAKSILLREGQGPARYRLLDTIRDFGLAKLRGRGNERALRRRHRAWYAALAARQEAFGPGRAAWIAALNADHENLRAALRFCLAEPGEAAAGAQLACDLWRYWETHGHLTEGRRILAALLDRLDHDDPHRPRALWTAGYLAELQGDILEARMLLEDGAAAGRATGDVRAIAYALTYLVSVLYYLGEPAQGQAAAEDALRRHGEAGDQIGVAQALMAIGYMHLFSGEPQPAAERFGECASVCASSGNVWYHTYAQWGLATARWLLGDRDGAAAPAAAALGAMRDLDDPIGVALCLDTLAWIAAGQGQALRALTLLSAVDAAWSAIQIARPNTLHEQHAAALSAARAATSDSAYQVATAKGAAMSEAEAIGYALGESPRPAAPSAAPPAENQPRLTRREQDVVALVARGMSNSQIAAALVISARTVETHVQHIMDKLGCGTRAQIAAWAAARPPAEQTPNIRTGIEDSPDAGRAAGRHRE